MKLEIAITTVVTIDINEQNAQSFRAYAKEQFRAYAKEQFKENFARDSWIGSNAFEGRATVIDAKATLFIDGQHAETV